MKGREEYPSPNRDELLLAAFEHEVGNVLHGLLGMARMALASSPGPTQANWLRGIEHSGEQMRRLLDAYRDCRTGPAGPPRPALRSFDGVRLLEQALVSHAPAAAARGSRLLLWIDPSLPRSWTSDRCMLRQVLDNLLGNAVKFAPCTEITLRAARPPGAADPRCLRLEVSDHGPGLGAARLPALVEPFRRGAVAERGGAEGSGLGLWICDILVRALGGRMRHSRPAGGGARFRFDLPGVLAPVGPGALEPSDLLRRLHCRLHLEGGLRRSVACLLQRLAVDWSDARRPVPRRARGQWLLHVQPAPPGPGAPGPGLRLGPAESPPGPNDRLLAGPVVESALGPLLLELALESIRRDGRRGSLSAPRPAGRPGARGEPQA